MFLVKKSQAKSRKFEYFGWGRYTQFNIFFFLFYLLTLLFSSIYFNGYRYKNTNTKKIKDYPMSTLDSNMVG